MYACLWGSEKPTPAGGSQRGGGAGVPAGGLSGRTPLSERDPLGSAGADLGRGFRRSRPSRGVTPAFMPSGDLALSALAVAVTAFLGLAIPFELRDEWMAVAWSVEVALLLWASGRWDLQRRCAPWPGPWARWWVSGSLLNPAVLDLPHRRPAPLQLDSLWAMASRPRRLRWGLAGPPAG